MANAFTTYAGVLPPVEGKPPEAAEQVRKEFTAIMRRNLPGVSMDDRFAQVSNYTDIVYTAINRRMKVLMGASIKVMQRAKSIQKALPAAGHEAETSEEWVPVDENHPAQRLFNHVNPQVTKGQFLAESELMLSTTGRSFIYWVPGKRTGKPVEMWTIRTQHISPAFQVSRDYPFGAWRITVPTPLTYGFAAAGNVVIDARYIIDYRLTHPMYTYDGYSPLTALGSQIDAFRSINRSRKNAMDRGVSATAVVNVPGADENELEKVKAKFDQR
jgi:hypothetical protein